MIYLRIPRERVAVLIGQKGSTKSWLQRRSGLRFDVDSVANEVVIHDERVDADPLMVLKLQDVVRAIARGFSPERAARLFADDDYLELLDIHDYVGKHKQHIRRVASRIIGSEGKTRRIIEDQTGAEVVVYGHTVGVIAHIDSLGDARHAVEMLLRGAEHASVYRFLERKRRNAKRAASELW